MGGTGISPLRPSCPRVARNLLAKASTWRMLMLAGAGGVDKAPPAAHGVTPMPTGASLGCLGQTPAFPAPSSAAGPPRPGFHTHAHRAAPPPANLPPGCGFSFPNLYSTSLKSFICRLSDPRAAALLRGSEEHRESSHGSAQPCLNPAWGGGEGWGWLLSQCSGAPRKPPEGSCSPLAGSSSCSARLFPRQVAQGGWELAPTLLQSLLLGLTPSP